MCDCSSSFADTTFNVTLVGVGGQGILLTAEILARTAALAGLSVKKSEIHGMSQRGGSVSSQVRFGKQVYSPIIPDRETNLLVCFDTLEAIRSRELLHPCGKALVDRCYLVPVTVSSGMQTGPENPLEHVEKIYAGRLTLIDSAAIAREIGNPRTANMAIAGALSAFLPFAPELWMEALRSRLPEAFVAMNTRAFECGRAAVCPS